MSIRRRIPPFTSSRRPLMRALGHSQWPEPPNLEGASTAARMGSRSHPALPLDRYGRPRAVRDSPSDIAACHRVVLRGTHSPVTRRATRAREVRAAPWVYTSQSGPKTAPKANQKAPQQAQGVPGVALEHCVSRNAIGALQGGLPEKPGLLKIKPLPIWPFLVCHFRATVARWKPPRGGEEPHLESGLNHRATETGLTPRYPTPPRKSSRGGEARGEKIPRHGVC